MTVDAALFAVRGEYGFGLVARDSAGGLVEARTRCIAGVVTAECAEAIAIKEALS